ncbi:hypothetical protein ARMGADRAFT_1092884 [Armillaria gallica]|uniref:Uncharacterized protein n=1 Tax=Armillaria gallica TaxID=47427 RepID=A0A2H3CTW8_ARMGA|nr:hypothetical protein ARMGADRAFT_1093043 [Armillaria gallica]PBK79699.1 hypothetical protein ARMGADRAFT_1092884 [Armillaria gallica]
MNVCSVKGMTFLGSGGGTTLRSIFFTKRSLNWTHGEDQERERGDSEEEGRRHCTPFGKTTRWGAGHALARRAAHARSLTTMEWPECLIVDDVERVLARLERGNLSSSSSFAAFTCAVFTLHD